MKLKWTRTPGGHYAAYPYWTIRRGRAFASRKVWWYLQHHGGDVFDAKTLGECKREADARTL